MQRAWKLDHHSHDFLWLPYRNRNGPVQKELEYFLTMGSNKTAFPPDLPPTCHSDRRSFRSRILRLRTFCPEKVCPERFSFYYRGLFCQSCFLQHEGRFYLTNGIREGLRTLEECLGSNSKIRYDFCAGRRIITDLSVESPYCSMSLDSKHTQPW